MTTWINNGVYTYVLLNLMYHNNRLKVVLPQFVEKYLGGDLKKYGFHWTLSLTPLKDVYFEPVEFDGAKHGDKTSFIFSFHRYFDTLIACINFVNLSTIRAVDRSKEVGFARCWALA